MTIFMLNPAFSDYKETNKNKFFEQIAPFKGKEILFRGLNESGSLRNGYLDGVSGDTVIISDWYRKKFVFPYWEIMIAI